MTNPSSGPVTNGTDTPSGTATTAGAATGIQTQVVDVLLPRKRICLSIQKLVAMGGVTTQGLLCLNKSVSDMLDSIAMLEAVLKQRLGVANCQINGGCM